ncbi:MAG TPA: polymer-forming cytoskeletal protein [Vicinamibacterales bacterium]|jgi:cytoskeletal protein CcmA (bactofilin family)|nr:polymer-forming cytoskeletal protein [Vicinamibacterales bacterium]
MASTRLPTIPATLALRGDIESGEDVLIAGDMHGAIWAERRVVTIAAAAAMTGDIVAADVTVHGSFQGTILASAVVEIAASGDVQGRIIAPRVILRDGGSLNGSVQPQRVDAAFRVAHHRRRAESEAAADEASRP